MISIKYVTMRCDHEIIEIKKLLSLHNISILHGHKHRNALSYHALLRILTLFFVILRVSPMTLTHSLEGSFCPP